MQNRFNLVYEDWIPAAGQGLVSLERVFKDSSLKSLGGTPINKISILKLLLGIAQAAYTPEDDEDWSRLGVEGMARKCLEYLYEKEDRFWLYGDKPFLQMKGLLKKEVNLKGKAITKYAHFRPYLPDVSSTNDTILFDVQIDRNLSDAEKTQMLISLMNYSPGGKRVENVGPLSLKYLGKGTSAKAGPSLGGYVGYLNTCLWSDTIINTVYANLFTRKSIEEMKFWQDLSIVPPWEDMPEHEDDLAAKRIQKSIYGSLCALSRFVLFTDEGMIYAEGLQYPSHKDGWREPFFSWNSKEQFLWIDTEKKPWRNFVSLLNLPMNGIENSYQCPQINFFWKRGYKKLAVLGVWSGGLQVRGTAGDQSVKQKDDFVESIVLIPSEDIGQSWFLALSEEITFLEDLSKILFSSMKRYYKDMNFQESGQISKAQYQYWEITEAYLTEIILYCQNNQKMEAIRRHCVNNLHRIFNEHCPSQTARQVSSWAKNRPRINTGKISKKEETFAEKTD